MECCLVQFQVFYMYNDEKLIKQNQELKIISTIKRRKK